MQLTLFNLRYQGLKGELDLTSPPYFYKIHNLLDYEWNALSSNLINGRGFSIDKFNKKGKAYDLTLYIKGDCEEYEYYNLLNDLTDFFEVDVVNQKMARLYCNDYYLNCYIVSQKKGAWKNGVHLQEIQLKVLAPYPMWIKESKQSFYPNQTDEGASEGKAYDHSYGYDYMYASSGSGEIIVNKAISPSRAMFTIYGYAENPLFKIGDNIYQVFDTIEEGERVVIDQNEMTVKKIYRNGIVEDIFGKRGKEHSVFKPIGVGNNLILSSGNFGIDITLFEERSEPKWK